LLFIGTLVFAFRAMIKNKAWGAMGSLTALLIFACFSYPFSVLPFLIVFVLLLAIETNNGIVHCGLTRNFLPIVNSRLTAFWGLRVKPAMTGITCLFLTAFCLYSQYPVYQAYKTWNSTRIYYHAGMYKETADNYEKLYPHLNDQIQFLFEYAQCLSKSNYKGIADQVRNDKLVQSNEVLQRAMQISCDPMLYNIMGKNYQIMKEYEQAENAFIKATQIVPNRLYPWYLLCKLYAEMGLQDKVCETAAILLTKEPKIQSPAINEMREEVRKLRIKN
jgi:tetratricopeptide (TPR) repeat protein